MTSGKIGVVLVAAGRGERAGQSSEGPKQYRTIGGAPVIAHTLRAFLAHSAIADVVVAIHPDDVALFQNAAGDMAASVTAVLGGATRQESTRLALLALRDKNLDAVLVHDAVRPFVDAALIDRVVAGLAHGGGSLPALPVSDTLKRAGADRVVAGTTDRAGLFAAQTPQGFPFAAILAAHQRADAEGRSDFTDDSAIAEWAGIPVHIVDGNADNTKITWAKDLDMANTRLGQSQSFPDVRTGNGYDVHAFEPGDSVILCGHEIPFDRKLSGHSDADVGLHALTDALLATCGAGDIGTHFPPSDMKWKGAASRIFVEEAVRIVRAKGGRIANADVTLICEVPKIGPHREAMTSVMADILGIARDRISVKATTNERLGFIGREEGIAAIVTATVVYPGELPE
jgi:2-C-methyl-D-erythritol 4-phosphate cytidylyltransferase/2-C-methyl-D-erythritol 2,4-cyclodiphosphate synthase